MMRDFRDNGAAEMLDDVEDVWCDGIRHLVAGEFFSENCFVAACLYMMCVDSESGFGAVLLGSECGARAGAGAVAQRIPGFRQGAARQVAAVSIF